MAEESFDIIFDEIMEELKQEEKELKTKKAELIKNGCAHANNIYNRYTMSKTSFF